MAVESHNLPRTVWHPEGLRAPHEPRKLPRMAHTQPDDRLACTLFCWKLKVSQRSWGLCVGMWGKSRGTSASGLIPQTSTYRGKVKSHRKYRPTPPVWSQRLTPRGSRVASSSSLRTEGTWQPPALGLSPLPTARQPQLVAPGHSAKPQTTSVVLRGEESLQTSVTSVKSRHRLQKGHCIFLLWLKFLVDPKKAVLVQNANGKPKHTI